MKINILIEKEVEFSSASTGRSPYLLCLKSTTIECENFS
jgi:hypothetical protein